MALMHHCCRLFTCLNRRSPLTLTSCISRLRRNQNLFSVCSKHWQQTRLTTRKFKTTGMAFVYLGLGLTFQKSFCIKGAWFRHLIAYCDAEITSEAIPVDNTSKYQYPKGSVLILLVDKLYSASVFVFRTIGLFVRFVPLLCLYPITFIIPGSRSLWWWALLVAMETAGPSFIKLGQWASTRRDLFSAEFCDRFSVLHHKVAVHKWYHTERRLTEAFGPDWRSLFSSFNEESEPVGSGCVAQVYKGYFQPSKIDTQMAEKVFKKGDREKGTWDDTGIPVAVKVCHPGIREEVKRDLVIMRVMAACLTVCLPSLKWLSLSECVHEFAVLMEKQLDLLNEARCLDKFADNFCSSPHIVVPRPIWPYVTREVLVETFEEGEHISTFIKDKECPKELKRTLAQLGVGALLKMIFIDNFIHGDLHPGNILVQNADRYCTKEGMGPGDVHKPGSDGVRLVLLDVGITASMLESDKHKFVAVFKAVVRGKGEEVADLFLTQSRISECRNPSSFRKEMTRLVGLARAEAASLAKVQVGSLLSQVFGLMIEHRIKVESNFASVILAIAVLEGLGRSLDPELNILKSAKPFLLSGSWKR